MRAAYWRLSLSAFVGSLLLGEGICAKGGWEDIPFVYSFEADDGEGAYVPGLIDVAGNQSGNLDGTWRRSEASDQWDGSSAEPGDGAPGGIAIEMVLGEGEDGGDASVLSVEDVGDPRGAGFPDPGNRKLFLWRDTSAELDLADGITLVARWRLNPEPLSSEFSNQGGALAVPNGSYNHSNGKGQIAFAQRAMVKGSALATFGLSITDEGTLQFAYNFNNAACAGTFYPAERCLDVDESDWLTVWLTAQDVAGSIRVKMYLNGDTEPAVDETWAPGAYSVDDDPVDLPEAPGTSASSILQLGNGNTGGNTAFQVDYISLAAGFIEPPTSGPGCPLAPMARVEGRQVVLEWTNGTLVPTAVTVRRDGEVIATDAPANPPTFTDVGTPPGGVPPGEHTYSLTFTVPGHACDPIETIVSNCPIGLQAIPTPEGVLLRWTNIGDYLGFSVTRDGTVIRGDIPGDDTSFTDTTVTAGVHTYVLAPEGGTCVPIEATVRYYTPVSGSGDYGAAAADWNYILDPPANAAPEEYLLVEPGAGLVGDLDGSWSSGNGSDSWDGSAPGEVGDPALDVVDQLTPGAEAPGGVGLVTDGGVGAYLIEDVGDPTAQGWLDPSNRKICLAHDLATEIEAASTQSLISSGMTFRARFRLTPAASAVDVTDAPNGLPTQNDGKGLFFIAHDASVTLDPVVGSQRIAISLDTNPDVPGTGILWIGDTPTDAALQASELAIPVPDPTQWIDLWLTLEDPDPSTPAITLTAWVNGSLDPFVALDDFLPIVQGAESGISVTPGNSVTMGLNVTGDSGSVQVDLLSVLEGVLPPEISTRPVFHRGDPNNDGELNITDGIYVLNFLFLGGPDPTCLESGDVNDDGQVNITDGIFCLNFLFLGGPAPAAPGSPGSPCGPDRVDSPGDLGCILYTRC